MRGMMKNSVIPGVLLLLLLSGCGLREVRFSVVEPPKVALPGVERLALLNFADPYHRQAYGVGFAGYLSELFRSQSGLVLIPPAEMTASLSALRLLPSRLGDPAVVAEVGRRIGADALLFGDVQEATVTPTESRESVSRKIGERYRVEEETLPDGKTRKVVRVYPVYREYWVRTVRRFGRFQAEARLVGVRDGTVLWQNQVSRTRETYAREHEDGTRSGDWSADDVFMEKLMRPAASQLCRDLLPRVLPRVRNLAEPGTRDEYAALLKQGNQAALQGDWDRAGSAWLKASVREPERPEAWANLGVLRERSGDFGLAAQNYETAARKLGSPWSEYRAEAERTRE